MMIQGRFRMPLYRGALVVGCLALWEAGGRMGLLNPDWFSLPSGVVLRLGRETLEGRLLRDAGVTLAETAFGFVFGALGGAALGIALARYGRLRRILMPYLTALYGIPRPALAPLFVLWFGIGLVSKVVLIFSLVYFILVLYVITGVDRVNPELVRWAHTLGASSRQVLTKVIVPSLLPWIFAALKLGLGLAIIGAVVGEFIASTAGLGYYVINAAHQADTQGIYVGIGALGVVSWFLTFAMERVERRLFHWGREAIL